MKFIANAALAIKGERVERGAEIDLSKDELAQFDPADLTSVDSIAAPAADEPVEEKAVEDMSLAELKAKAEELKLSTSGTKADLIERIALHDGAPVEEAAD